MKSLIINIVLFMLLLMDSNAIKAQRDTIFIVDTLYVHDTIYISSETYLKNNYPDSQHISSKITTFSINFEGNTATIPISGISLSENFKKIQTMKTLTLSTFFMILLKTVMAQSDYGFFVKPVLSGFYQTSNDNNQKIKLSETLTPGIGIGGFYRFHSTEKLAIEFAPGFFYISGKEGYQSAFNNSTFYGDLENFLIQTAYTQLYFPVRIIWGSRKLSPSIGFQYEIKRSTDKFQMLAENNSYRDYKNTMHQFGPEIGLNYMLNKKIFLNLYYYIGILNNPQRLKSENELLFNTNNNLKPMTLSFVLSINLNHKNIQKDGIPAIE